MIALTQLLKLESKGAQVMFFSTAGIVSVALAFMLSLLPAGHGANVGADIAGMVDRGVGAVAIGGDLPGPGATLPSYDEYSAGVSVASAQDESFLPDEILAYIALHPEYAQDPAGAASPSWVGTMLADGEQWVYAGVWYRCGGLGMGLNYAATSPSDPAFVVWNQLSEDAHTTIYYTCYNKLWGGQ